MQFFFINLIGCNEVLSNCFENHRFLNFFCDSASFPPPPPLSGPTTYKNPFFMYDFPNASNGTALLSICLYVSI